MADRRTAQGVPATYKRILWSKIIDTMVGSSVANNDLLVRASGLWGRLAAGSDGQYLKTVSGAPTWSTLPSGGSVDEYYASAYQSSDHVVTNATTGTTFVDTEVLINLAAGTYRYEFVTFGVAHTTPDFKQRLHFTGTATEIKYIMNQTFESDTNFYNAFEETFDVNHPWTTATGDVSTTYQGTVKVTVSGDLSYQFAQNTASATSITHSRGSAVIVWKIA